MSVEQLLKQPPAPARSAGSAPAQPALDLHEGIVEPPPSKEGCPRWPKWLSLQWTRGEMTGYVDGRCGATNKCLYCQRLYVVETVEMLTLDATENAPALWFVLTAREHLTRKDCRQHLEAIRRSVRKRWPNAEWFVQVEFQRRGALHLNLLVKGIPVDELEQAKHVVAERWCARVDALPVGQWGGVIADGVGVVRYISKMLAHGLKAEQAPPIGWKGHRTSQTRGYLVRPASVMREEARASLRVKREFYRYERSPVEAADGTLTGEVVGDVLDGVEINELVNESLKRNAERSWECVVVDLDGARLHREAFAPLRRAERRRRAARNLSAASPAAREAVAAF